MLLLEGPRRNIGGATLLIISVFASAVEAQTPPGTVIRNGATVTYQAATGAPSAPISDSAFVTVGSPAGIAITLNKAVDLTTGTFGDVLTYTIKFQGIGSATASSVLITDPLPAGAAYVAGSMTLNGTPLTDAKGDDAGSFNAGSRRVSVTLPDLSGSSSGVITFRARLDGTAAPSNVAHVAYTTPSGPDSAVSNAATTTLTYSAIAMAVSLDAPAPGVPARAGDPVTYRVHYANPANGVIARNVVVTDTLPPGLQYVGSIPASPAAVPAKVVSGGGVLTWTIGDIAPGTTGDLVIQTVVAATLTDSTTVVNHVWVNLANGPAVTSPAPAILLLPATSQLTLVHTADVLEVGLGQTVPYTLALENRGVAPLADFRIVAHLPEGARYTPRSALGADSVIVTGGGHDVTFYVAGQLAAGASHNVRYQVAVVSAPPAADVVQSSATASAEGGSVVSAQATAWVRVRHAYPLETRAVIGKVFIDANGNGRQDAGEHGVEGVAIWTDDGEVATTDSLGRFSFSNLRPGRHAYRVDGATLPPGLRAPDPAQARDGSGWTTPRVDFALAPGVAHTAPLPGHDAVATTFIGVGPVVPALRDSAARAGEERRALTAGPAVTFFAPRDGAILPTERIFVGVHGEPGAAVVLFDGARRIADGRVRGDGVNDFIAVPLAPGPHRLRVKMQNSWSQDRWDSLNVHVVGRPARFVYEGSKVILTVGGQRVDTVYVHVLDQWNVPVMTGQGALVTVSADGAEVLNTDADGSSVGLQVRTDSTGVLALALRGGHDVRVGSLALRADGATAHLRLEILPAASAFMLTAAGQVGVGASPDAFGAATARGRLDARTAVLVSVDSRQLDAGSENFGRAVDPLGDAQYPILGDAGLTGTQSASRYAVAARVERGLDWLAFGDLSTGAFAGGLTLSGYDRALAGVAGRITTGPIVWQGFGSTTSERLAQQQIRGAGMSGPYDVGLGIKAGTERVVLETRAYDDAQQTLAREALTRFVDYQIDYDRGLLLFKQPVPATDPSGNPVFIMITYGADGGGAQSTVWGVRATADARGLVRGGHESLDSLRIGATFIRDGRPGAERDLSSLDFGVLRVGRIALHGELAHSQTPDSAGFATSVGGAITFAKGLTVSGEWLHTDAQFHNPANLALAGGSNDLKLAARFQMGAGGPEVQLEHSEQSFDLQNVSRAKSGAFVVQRLGAFRLQAGLSGTRLNSGTTDDATRASEVRLIWSPFKRLDFTADARHHLGEVASAMQPDYIGAGVTYKASAQTSLELTERQVELPGGSRYSVTSLGGRSELGMGTRAWGSYQMAGANGGQVAAVVGLNNRLQLGPEWTLNTLFERRFGLSSALTADPIRALPFTQAEENYWSAGFGAEYLPEHAPYRLTMRSEVRDGTERSSRLFTLAGAANLSSAFALITRQEFQGADDRQPTGGAGGAGGAGGIRVNHQRLSSINGLAFRPVGSDAFNFLAKVQVIDEQNPLGGGVLTGVAGHEARRIYMAEAIWSPSAWLELGGRYAFRTADATVTHADSVVQPLSSSADYVGARLDIALSRWLRARGDSRLLRERTSGTSRWDAAPQLVLVPVRGIEIANGYRFGDLSDPDFSVRGGHGWFMTIGATITERSLSTIAGFWGSRQ